MRRLELTGKRFGRLLVLEFAGRNAKGHTIWTCLCKCGARKRVARYTLTSGHSRSCGCLQKELDARRSRTHGMTHLPEHSAWRAMKYRCSNPNCQDWKDYGGRGIRVCRRWLRSFAAFYSSMGPRPPGLTLDRRNNDGNYEPGNCRWASRSIQSKNQRPKRPRANSPVESSEAATR
jgi:hypothetical protein